MTQKDGRDLRYINLAMAHVKTLMLAAAAYHPAISLKNQAPGTTSSPAQVPGPTARLTCHFSICFSGWLHLSFQDKYLFFPSLKPTCHGKKEIHQKPSRRSGIFW
jgi:hypothetical protein